MMIREQLEDRELKNLSCYASFSKYTKGRQRKEQECDIRPAFQRDRDRVIHSKAFRRLKQKTQVFLFPKGDHYRTRLTHTLEVSQIARTIAKALRLNEDLTEAIALGHDLGHTPFGHAGERALNEVYRFVHNEQSLRVVDHLERNGEGLNLTWEVRDGILNHKTACEPQTLEGQIVRLSDKIAYLNHDIDDAVRGGILTENTIPAELQKVLGSTGNERLGTLIHDVIEYSMDRPKITMSEGVGQAMSELRSFMFEHVYENREAKREEDKAVHLVKQLFLYYVEHYELLPRRYLEFQERYGTEKEQIVCDYISGMTDTYAVKKFNEIFVPEAWKY